MLNNVSRKFISNVSLATRKAKANYDIDNLDLDSNNTTVESVVSINSNTTDDLSNVKIESIDEKLNKHMNNKKKVTINRKLPQYNLDDIHEEPLVQPERNSIAKAVISNSSSILIDELVENGENSKDSVSKYESTNNKNRASSFLNNKVWSCGEFKATQSSESASLEIDEYDEENSNGVRLNFQIVSYRKSSSKKPAAYDLDEILNDERATVRPNETKARLRIENLFENSESEEGETSDKTPEEILSISTNSLTIEDANGHEIQAENQTSRSHQTNSFNNFNSTRANNFEPSTHNWLTNYTQTPVKTKLAENKGANNNRRGTEWLREASEKLNQTVAANQTCLNESCLNESLNTTTRKVSPTMLTVNTSSLFLNESDIRKRKIKFVKYIF